MLVEKTVIVELGESQPRMLCLAAETKNKTVCQNARNQNLQNSAAIKSPLRGHS